MIKRYRSILYRIMLILLLLVVASSPRVLAQASQVELVKIRLAVTDAGIECLDGCSIVQIGGNKWAYTIEVEQGARVELTFVWSHQSYLRDEHIMVLKDYNLEWDKISSGNREATLQFIADKPGAFNFKCDLECEIHDFMQQGTLEVKRGGGAAAFSPTLLKVSSSVPSTAGEAITLMAVLKDATSGDPVPKAEIHFYIDAEFAGAHGKMQIGKAKSDSNGIAFFDFQPTLSVPQYRITAHFAGAGIYDESENTVTIVETGVPPAAYTVDPENLPGVRFWAPPVLAGILAGIWLAFAYVLFQVYGIWKDRARIESP